MTANRIFHMIIAAYTLFAIWYCINDHAANQIAFDLTYAKFTFVDSLNQLAEVVK